MPREEYQRALTAGDDRRTQIALQHQTFDSFLSYSFPPQFLCHTCSHILFSSSSHVDRVSSIIHNQSTLEKKDRLLFFFFFSSFFFLFVTGVCIDTDTVWVATSVSWLFSRTSYFLFVFVFSSCDVIFAPLLFSFLFFSSLLTRICIWKRQRGWGRKEGSKRNRNYERRNKKIQGTSTLAHQTCIMHLTYEKCVLRVYDRLE